MASYVNTNISSLNAQRNLTASQSSLATSLQRLSSGMRINSAKDDAAGLAISQRFAAQIGGLTQAGRNANDAISLSQTAEGALSGIGDNLQRLRTLAVQSANSTNSDSDRAAIQNEVGSLVSEIQRVSGTTQFNGINLLDGSFKAQTFQVGANANQTIAVSVDSADTSKLGSTQASSLTASNNGTALSGGDLILNGVSIADSSSSSDTASTTSASSSAISKAAAINASTSLTGVVATVNTNVMAGTTQTGSSTGGTITINGVTTSAIAIGGTNLAADRTAAISAINLVSGQTGVVATDGGSATSGITLSAADGRNIALSVTTMSTSSVGLAAAGTNYGSYSLTSTSAINVSGTSSSLKNAGVIAGSYSTQTAYATTSTGTATAFTTGDFRLNGVIIGASVASSDTASTANAASSAISKAAAINAITSQTNVTALVNANILSGGTQTSAATTGTLTINGVATATIVTTATAANASAERAAAITAINAITGQTGVTAIDGGSATNGISLVAADGRNISVTQTASGTGSALGLNSAVTGTSILNFESTVTLSSSSTFTITAGTTSATAASIGGLANGTYGQGKSGQSLSTINVSTAAGANAAITAIDNAITSVNSSRANLGAIQNRFASTVSTLASTTENLTAAKSRITDADFASETANLTRAQILQQAGTAILAQANSLPNGVLALLR